MTLYRLITTLYFVHRSFIDSFIDSFTDSFHSSVIRHCIPYSVPGLATLTLIITPGLTSFTLGWHRSGFQPFLEEVLNIFAKMREFWGRWKISIIDIDDIVF